MPAATHEGTRTDAWDFRRSGRDFRLRVTSGISLRPRPHPLHGFLAAWLPRPAGGPGGGGGRDLLGPARAGGGGAARRGQGPDRPPTGLCFSIRPPRGAWDSGSSGGLGARSPRNSRVLGWGGARGPRKVSGSWGSQGPGNSRTLGFSRAQGGLRAGCLPQDPGGFGAPWSWPAGVGSPGTDALVLRFLRPTPTLDL